MDQEQLKRLKTELEAEIRKIRELDKVSQEKLSKLISAIKAELRKPHDPVLSDDLRKHLEENIRRFEVSHPDLTTVMNNMMVMLSNLGI